MRTDRSFANHRAYPSFKKESQCSAPNICTIWEFGLNIARYSGLLRKARISEFYMRCMYWKTPEALLKSHHPRLLIKPSVKSPLLHNTLTLVRCATPPNSNSSPALPPPEPMPKPFKLWLTEWLPNFLKSSRLPVLSPCNPFSTEQPENSLIRF